MLREEFQQLELLVGEIERPRVDRDLVGIAVDRARAEPDRAFLGAADPALQHRQPHPELGFGRARIEQLVRDLVPWEPLEVRAFGDHHDREARARRAERDQDPKRVRRVLRRVDQHGLGRDVREMGERIDAEGLDLHVETDRLDGRKRLAGGTVGQQDESRHRDLARRG